MKSPWFIRYDEDRALRLYYGDSFGHYAEKYVDGVIYVGVSMTRPICQEFLDSLQELMDYPFPKIVYHTTIESEVPVGTVWAGREDLSGTLKYKVIERNKEVLK